MSADPVDQHTAEHSSGAAHWLPAPGQIRSRLLPEERGDFDAEWRLVMTEARETRRLDVVAAMLDRWQLVAELTTEDPDRHRRMLGKVAASAADAAAGRLPAGESAAEVKARLGLSRPA